MKKRERNLPLSKRNFLHNSLYTDCRARSSKVRYIAPLGRAKARPYTSALCGGAADAHAVERTVDEGEGNGEEGSGEDVCQRAALRGGQSHGEFDGEQAEERCELDDRVQRNGRRIFKRIADGVADDGGVVKRRAFLFEFHFHNFLGVVPGGTGVGHEVSLVQAERGDGDQVANEEERLDEREGQCGKKHRDEDVEYALLRILGADLDDFFAVGDARLFRAFEVDVGFNEFDGAVCAGGHRLRGGAGEPINDGTTGDEAEDERRVKQRELVDIGGQAVGEGYDDREDHGGGAHNRRTDEHRLGGGLEGIARAVVRFQQVLGALEVHVDVVVLLEFRLDAGNLLNERQLKDRLRVIGYRAVRVHRDGHRAHAEEPESYQAKSEHRLRHHEVTESLLREEIADGHQHYHAEPQVVAGEISRHEAGENAERCSAFLRGGHHFLDMPRFDRGEDFHQLRDDGPGQRAAGDDGRQFPPLRRVAIQRRDDERRNQVGQADRNERGNPNERSQRRLEVHFVGVGEARLGDGAVDEVRCGAGDQHDDAHHKDPHQQLHLDRGILHRQQNEGDERDAGYAVSFESVRGRSHRISR